MRKIRDVLRLHYQLALSERQIVTSCRLSRGSVRRYLKRAKELGLSWPLSKGLDDVDLEKQFFPSEQRKVAYELPDFTAVHAALKHRGVTLFLVWEDYRSGEPRGLSYSRFCYLYRDFKGTLSPRDAANTYC